MRLPAFINRLIREPTKSDKPTKEEQIKMVTLYGEHYYAWNGKLYESDVVRACIRPNVTAIGKLMGKHIRDDPKNGIAVNQVPYIREILQRPNPHMTMQQLLERMATQFYLNNNAFALIIRNPDTGSPMQLYPIPCTNATAIEDEDGKLYIKFQYSNGNSGTFAYSDIWHIYRDALENKVFGEMPGAALAELMNCVGTIDQGIVKAIKNSGIIRWLLKFNSSLRPEDIKKNTKEFVDNYLSFESETFGAAGTDSKVDAKQIEPKDYVPNAAITDRITDRIYSFFNTNKHIVQSDYDENQWNAFFEANIEPLAIQLSGTLTARMFTKKELSFGNRIVFEASNLACASMQTKLSLVQMVDRGALSVNEWRAVLNLPPIPDGDIYIRRLDTAPVTENMKEGGETDGKS